MRSSRNEWTIARGALKDLLAQADVTARALGSDKFRSPRSRTDGALIDSGRAFAADIEPLKNDFIKHGFSPEKVIPAVEAFERATRAYTNARAKRSAAIREFEGKLETAMGLMHRFEALVGNTLADNHAAMAEWTVARTVNRVAVRKRQVKPPEPAQPVAQPVAA